MADYPSIFDFEDESAPIDLTEKTEIKPANEDIFMQLAELKKQYPKYQLHSHLNKLVSDDELRKMKILKRMNEKLNKKKINLINE